MWMKEQRKGCQEVEGAEGTVVTRREGAGGVPKRIRSLIERVNTSAGGCGRTNLGTAVNLTSGEQAKRPATSAALTTARLVGTEKALAQKRHRPKRAGPLHYPPTHVYTHAKSEFTLPTNVHTHAEGFTLASLPEITHHKQRTTGSRQRRREANKRQRHAISVPPPSHLLV